MARRQVKKKLPPAAWGFVVIALAAVATLVFVRHDTGGATEISPIMPSPSEAAPGFSPTSGARW